MGKNYPEDIYTNSFFAMGTRCDVAFSGPNGVVKAQNEAV